MESTTSMKDDLERDKSFSFNATSAFKDCSSIAHFSDDNVNEDDQKNDTMSDTDDNSFIEIAIDHPKFDHHDRMHQHEEPSNSSNHRKLDQDLDNLRISFSSSFPSNMPESHSHAVADFIEPPVVQALATSSFSSSSVRFSASTFRSSSTGICRGPVLGSESFSLYESSRRRDHLPAFNPLVHTLLFSLEPPAAVTVDENSGNDNNNWEHNHTQLAMINADRDKYRKSSNNTTTTTTTATTSGCNHNNGIIKLLMIKFRATRVRKLFTSLFAKPRGHVNFSSKKGNDRYNNMRKRLRPYINSKEKPEYYDHHEEMYYFGNDNVSVMNDIYSSCHDDRDHHQRVDVNLGEVRGVLEAVNMTRSGRSKRKTSSCPSSIKCSPIHQGFAGDHIGQFCGGESSIQAAIDHCKSSLGQSSDIRF